MDRITKLKNAVLRHERTFLWAGIVLFIVVFVAVQSWKYAAFRYDGIDLAIFNQVFWNTVHGRFFAQTINPNSYLGDHAGLAILPLSLLYAIWQDPRTLLVIQTVALALAALPLFAIAKHAVKGRDGVSRFVPLAIVIAWLMSPLVQNADLYEFHLLAVAQPFIFLALLAYVRERRAAFVAWAVAAMLFREDIALIIAFVGILAMFEKRGRWWCWVPLAMGAAWFAAGMRLISAFAPKGGYKFAVYYSWMGGNTLTAALAGALSNPLRVVAHMLTIGNIDMLVGFGLPLLFVPLLAPRRLLLAVAPLAAILLGAPGGGEMILRTEYAMLFLPGLFMAAVAGLASVLEMERRPLRLGAWPTLGVFALAVAYSSFVLGPVPHAAAAMMKGVPPDAAAAEKVVDAVPDGASVAAGYRLLPRLSSRTRLYALHSMYLGVSQFGLTPYRPDPPPHYLAVDETDFLDYLAQFPNTSWASPHVAGGDERLDALNGAHVVTSGTFTLIDTQKRTAPTATQTPTNAPLDLASGTASFDPGPPGQVRITARWTGSVKDARDDQLDVRLLDDSGNVRASASFPLAPPLFTTPSPTGERFAREYRIATGAIDVSGLHAELVAHRDDAVLVLDPLGSTTRYVRSRQDLGTWHIANIASGPAM